MPCDDAGHRSLSIADHDRRQATGMAHRMAILWFYWNLGFNFNVVILPTKIILVDDLAVEPSALAMILAITGLPWAVRPICALDRAVSDPCHRSSQCMASSVIGSRCSGGIVCRIFSLA